MVICEQLGVLPGHPLPGNHRPPHRGEQYRHGSLTRRNGHQPINRTSRHYAEALLIGVSTSFEECAPSATPRQPDRDGELDDRELANVPFKHDSSVYGVHELSVT
jgi:hypothetical protein